MECSQSAANSKIVRPTELKIKQELLDAHSQQISTVNKKYRSTSSKKSRNKSQKQRRADPTASSAAFFYQVASKKYQIATSGSSQIVDSMSSDASLSDLSSLAGSLTKCFGFRNDT